MLKPSLNYTSDANDEDLFSNIEDSFISDDEEFDSTVLEQDAQPEEVSQKSYWGFSGDGSSRISFSWTLLRIPLFIVIMSFIILDLVLYFLVCNLVTLFESFNSTTLTRLHEKLKNASNYYDYGIAARQLDAKLGNDTWKETPTVSDSSYKQNGNYYDEKLVSKVTRRLKGLQGEYVKARDSDIKKNLVLEMIKILRHGGCRNNIGNIDNEVLYSHSFIGSKAIVSEYYSQLESSLSLICNDVLIDSMQKVDFFRYISRVYGRTALCLSGGATLGYYHIGVVKALFENGILPRVITGTSAGALIGALVCCRTDQELVEDVFTPDVYAILDKGGDFTMENLQRLWNTGALYDFKDWYERTTRTVTFGEMTFLEAYKKTRRILNITIVPDEPYSAMKVCNYITTPDVVIASAVIASAAIPHVLNPVTLLMKHPSGKVEPYLGIGVKWRDGSLRWQVSILNQ